MKKAFLIISILLVAMVASIIILPVIFKDDIVAIVKEEANNNVNAKVNFGDFDISMISSFPDFSFSMENVLISGIGLFENDTLIHLGSMELTVDLMSVVSGDEIAIKTIALNEVRVHAIVLEDGVANWDISSDTSAVSEPEISEDTAATAFQMSLKQFSITNADIIYDDQEGDIYSSITGLNFEMSGDFTQDVTSLQTHTEIEGITVRMDNVNYLTRAHVVFSAVIDADLLNSKYSFDDNRFGINGLELGWDGWVAMPGEDVEMDLKFNASKTAFSTLLSLVPAIYSKDFEDVKTAGEIALNGHAKGVYTDDALPAFGVNLKVDNAMFQYPDLPGSAENININVGINNPGGSEDNTVIDVSAFHIELAGNPMDMHLVLKTPISDPHIDCGIKGDLDLGKMKEVIPLEEEEEMQGLVRVDMALKGNLSTIENEDYENFNAQGGLTIENIQYQNKDFPQGVVIESAVMNFSPQNVDLANFDCKIGRSDLHLNGTIDNFIAYALTDTAVLTGRYTFTSSMFDLNEFMAEGEPDSVAIEDSSEDTTDMEIIEIPGNIDFVLASKIDRILYDQMDMADVFGLLRIKDKQIDMQGLRMDMLGGSMEINGSYNTIDKNKPVMDFNLKINDFDIPRSYETFGMMKKMAPIMKNCNGSFSAQFDLVSGLDHKMEPIYNSMNGGGGVQSNEVVIKGSPTIEKLSAVLKNDKYKELNLQNLDATFQFKDGRLFVDPFETNLGNSTATISGSNGFDLSLDYLVEMEIPTSEFGSGVSAAINQVTSLINNAGANVSAGDALNVGIVIGGTSEDPVVTLGKISPVGGEASVKEQVADEIDKKIDEAKEQAKEEIDKAKADAEKQLKEQAEKIISEAEKQAAKLIEEAKKLAGVTKKEGYDNAQKLENEASNPLQKIAAKAAADQLRKEADKQANKIIDAAANKAKTLVDNARKKAGGPK